MHKEKTPKRQYQSYEDFEKAFFPKKKGNVHINDDPIQRGTEMARQTLKKLRQALCSFL